MRHRLLPPVLLLLAVTAGCGGAPASVGVAGAVEAGPVGDVPPTTDAGSAPVPAADGDSSQADAADDPPVPAPPTGPVGTGDEGTVVSVDGAPAVDAAAACRRGDGAVRVRLGVDTDVVVTGSSAASRMALVGPDGTTPAARTEVFAKRGVVTTIGTFDPSALGVVEVVVSHDAAVPPC